MSRVRILNLPHDCTEKELREHFTKHVPPTAPPLEITDVMIMRIKTDEEGSGGRGRGRGGGGGRGRGDGGGGRGGNGSARLGKIRMAFVGFRSSAAGHFVVGYYNQSYFRSSKIKVELAKGLNEVGVTLNMRKRLEKQQQKEDEAGAAGAVVVGGRGGEGNLNNSAGTSGKRPREGNIATGASCEHDHDSEKGILDNDGEAEAFVTTADGRKKTRKELFIEERTKATEGPSWAAEILVPQEEEAAKGPAITDAEQLQAAIEKAEAEAEAAVEEEKRALAKQQTLGAVSDLDFLSGLGGGGGGGGNNTNKLDEEPKEDEGEGEEDGGEGGEQVAKHISFSGATPLPDAKDGETATKEASHTATTTTVTSSSSAAKKDAEGSSQEDIALDSSRVRIGNIPYTATEDHVKQFAASLVGPVEAVHIPLTKDTRQSKGAAFVKFVDPQDAVRALTLCRGAILMGRLLRVSAAEEDPHSKLALEREARRATSAGNSLAGSSEFKIKKELGRRGGGDDSGVSGSSFSAQQAGHVSWNTMYMNSSAAVDNVAQRLGVKSDDLVSVQAKGAAVRAAIAEAYLTSEIQQVLSDEGVALDVIESGQQSLLKARSNTTILVKNLQLTGPEEAAELSKLFVKFGTLETSVFPSSGTFALFRFVHPQDARTAFTRLSYKLFKNAPLFLEWAPVGAIVEDAAAEDGEGDVAKAKGNNMSNGADVDGNENDLKARLPGATVVYTLFITNIPFTTTEDDFHAFLLDSCPRLAKAPDVLIKRLAFHGQQQGRAYLTVADAATFSYCLAKLNHKSLEGRTLSCVASTQTEMGTAAAAAGGSSSSLAAAAAKHKDGRGGVAVGDDEEEALLRRTGAVGGAHKSNANSTVPPGADPYKIIVKNVPFEATEADVRELFSAFSEIKSVRLPRKTNNFTKHRENNHRGFAFVEFLSEAEAARAMDVLKATHLYGRHLVLQYARLDG